jgi:hypothetical protein
MKRAAVVLVCGLSVAGCSTAPAVRGVVSEVLGNEVLKEDIAMKKLQFLLGEWKGQGWIRQRDGVHRFEQKETVKAAEKGTALTVVGRGTAKDQPEKVVHQAQGVLRQSGKDTFVMTTRSPQGEIVEAPVKIEGQTVTWGFENPHAGKIRFTLTVDKDTWVEKGEVSRDAVNWNTFLEMTLQRKE